MKLRNGKEYPKSIFCGECGKIPPNYLDCLIIEGQYLCGPCQDELAELDNRYRAAQQYYGAYDSVSENESS